MNKAFKVIWNHATQTWVAASEIARAKGKTKSVKTAKTVLAAAITTVAISGTAQAATATADTPQSGTTLIDTSPEGAIAIGAGAKTLAPGANAWGSIAIGKNATAKGVLLAGGGELPAIAIGQDASAIDSGTALGLNAKADNGQQAVAIGTNANASADRSVAVGVATQATAQQAAAMGWNAKASGVSSLSLGTNSTASGGNSVAISGMSSASGDQSMALGYYANAAGKNSVAVGAQTGASADRATVVGYYSKAQALDAAVLGSVANASAVNATAIGRFANAMKTDSIAVGTFTHTPTVEAVAIGTNSATGVTRAEWDNLNALHLERLAQDAAWDDVNAKLAATNLTDAERAALQAERDAIRTARGAAHGAENAARSALAAAATTKGEIVIGSHSLAKGNDSIIVGNNNTITTANTFVLGHGINRGADLTTDGSGTVANSVYLGNESEATAGAAVGTTLLKINQEAGGTTTTAGDAGTVADATVGGVTYGGFAGATANGVVTVGASGAERRIQNVAAGEISATSTDAINGSQLYATNAILANVAISTVNALGGDAVLDPKTGEFNVTYNLTGTDPSKSGSTGTNYTSVGDALTALSEAVNQPITFKGDEGSTTQELGSTLNIIAGNATDTSTRNVKTNVTAAGQLEISFSDKPTFTEVTVEENLNVGPVTINSTTGIDAGNTVISNVTAGTKGTDAVNLDQLNATKTAVLAGKNTTVTPAPNTTTGGTDYTINAVDTSASASVAADSSKYLTVTQNGTTAVGDANVTDYAIGLSQEALNALDNATNAVTKVTDTNTVNLNVTDGTLTADVITNDGAGTTVNTTAGGVSFDIKTDGTTVKVGDNNALTVVTGGTEAAPNGTATVSTGSNTTDVATIGDLVDTINNVGWYTNSTNVGGNTTGTAADTKITAGKAVNFEAGKNLKVEQKVVNGNVTYTYSAAENVSFTNVTVNSSLPTDDINVGDAGNKTETQILNLTSANPDAVVTAKDLANYGWIVATPNNSYDEAVKSQDRVNFIGDGGVVVNGETNTTTGAYDVVVKLSAAGSIEIANMTTANGTTEPSGKLAVDENETGFITAGNVVNIINQSGWRTNSTTATVTAKETLVNPGDQVNFEAGNNMQVTQEINATTGVISYTYATKDDLVLNSTTVNSTTIGGSYKNEAGDVIKTSPITIMTTPEGKNVINNLTTTLPPTTSFNITNDAGEVVTAPNKAAPITAQEAQNIANTSGSNAATLGDVLNAGWNLQGNGEAVDFVKPYDTVNFKNGEGTTAVVSSDGNVSTIQYNVNVDGKTTQITYVNAKGDQVTKVGDKFYNPSDLDENGVPKAGATPVENVTSQISAIGPKVNGNATAGNINFANSTTANISYNSTTGDVKVEVVTGDTTVENGKATVKDGDEGKIATVGDIVNTINNVSWNATAGKVAGTNGEVKGNAATAVKAGDTVTLNAGNNIRIEQDGKTFNISTTENVSFKNMNVTGNTTLGNLTVQPNSTVNMGGNVITNVGAGTNGTDAVNLNQLNASVAAAKTEVTSTDKTVTVTQKAGDKGQTIYDLSVKTDSTTIKPNATTGALEVVTGKTTTTKDGKAGLDGANATDIATVGDIVNTINNVSWNATAGKVAGTNGEVKGNAATAVKAGDTVTLNAGNNIRIEQDGKTFNISTTDNVSFTTANATTVNVGGDAGNTALTTVAGGNYNSEGQKIDDAAVPALSVGGNQITNVANGAISPSSTDAINGSQLYALQSNINNQIGDVNNRIGDLDKNRKAGSASAMAAAGLPQAYREGQSGIVAALGQYEGETGVAVGFTSISDNGKWLFRGSYATNSQNENAGNLGIGYYW